MAEGGWGGCGRGAIRHHSQGMGYLAHPPPPYPMCSVPNFPPPPPFNGYMQPPLQYSDMYGNASAPARPNWGYTNSYSVPSRMPQMDKSYSNFDMSATVHNHVSEMDRNYNAGVNDSNIPQNAGRRTFPKENNFASNEVPNENVGGNNNTSRGRGGARGRGTGGPNRGRRGGRRRPYGGDRGGGAGGSGGNYAGRPDSGDFQDQVDNDELKRAGRDSALAETAAFMRNLNIGIGSESSNAPPQVEESTSTARTRGVSRKRPGRARNGGWGQQRDYIEEKQGKEWKNRQVKTECQDEQQVNKATKPVKERNGASNKQWSNVNSESKTASEVTPISRSEGLIEQLSRGLYECMVCCDRIKQPQAIWSCLGCYNCFHLGCIKKWAKTSAGDGGWRCPACQGFTAKVPNTYLCFCGKVREPEWNHRETPHSCGEICGRKRKIEWCKHKCNILCHPGPCPPCSAFIRRSCPCGTETREVRCSMTESFLCGNPCNKDLNCGGHKCPTKCHVGPCQECAEIVKQSCYCGKEDREVPCTAESFEILKYECGKECSRILECGNHKCSSNCHAGDCQRCEKAIDVVLRCPCDKVPLEKIYERDGVIPRKSCSDPVPTCGQICSRKLKCGVPGSYHECQAMCHEGPCPPCPLSTPVKCRCGSLDQEVSCSELTTKADEVRCKRACKKMRECGRHKCSTRCCIDIDHICTLICGRTLTCGLHKCEDTCHRGNCRRCQETSFEELTCHCGAQVTFPPIPCGTKPPECNNPCSRPMPCGHTPTHNCHPEDNCPPCTILVDKPCFGNHKAMKSTPCYLKALSCGSVCNKPLSCGQHNCLLVCHEQPCVAPGSSCPQKCLKSRDSCGHPCGSACHTGPCPDVTCKEMVIITCGCGHRTSMLKCSENDREYRAMTTSLLASQMRNMNSGCSVDISEIFTATARPDKLKRLTCNEDCKTLERNRRLAMALQIENPETRETLGNSSNLYSDFMKEEARKDPSLAKMVHDTLTELVMKAKESKQKSRSHSFAPMNRDKRRFIHEYCEHFGCQSQAYDEEPKKNVVATAVKGTCYLPPISVLTQLQREQGQKKVPGPVWSRKAVTS